MIEKFLVPVLEYAGKALVNGATSLGKAVVTHFAKHGTKYAIGGGIAAASGTAYAVGESIGHAKGKKEGTVEQAYRDEKKLKEMHQKHEKMTVSVGMNRNKLMKICLMKLITKKQQYGY